MATSIVERYERILKADPKSRVFVELARALLERGEPDRAIAVCERGVEHHPDSVMARVIWGKALLAVGRHDEAVDRLREATAVDPSNPYAYDLVGEALVRAGLGDRARGILETGAQLHSGNPRIQLWLREAATAMPALTLPRDPTAPAAEARDAQEPGSETGSGPTVEPEGPPAPPEGSPAAPPQPPPIPRPDERPTGAAAEPVDPLVRALALIPDEPLPEEARAEDRAPAAEPVMEPVTEPVTESTPPVTEPVTEPGPADAAAGETGAPPEPPAPPPPEERASPQRFAANVVPLPVDHETHAAQVASDYESELRQRLLSERTPRRGFVRRHGRALILAAAVVAILAGVATFVAVRERNRDSEARAAVDSARKGLARDTLGSLREAARVLAEARRGAAARADASAVTAEVLAMLAHDFDDADARGAARELLASGGAGRGAVAARWLLSEDGAEREGAAAALLIDSYTTPLASALAGEILLARHDFERARRALESAGGANPPLLRALSALGDADALAGDPAAALERYRVVLRAQPTHPRAAMGAAEMSLLLGRDLGPALRTLEAVAADPLSVPPVQDRLRFEVLLARLLAASGRPADALRRLDESATRHAGRPEVAAARADALWRSGQVADALAAAEIAVRLAPRDGKYRELLAQLQLRQGRYRDLLASTETEPTRTVRTYRGIARLELGDAEGARAELAATQRDGKMPPEAAAWMALAELASGRRAEAAAIIDVLLASPAPHPAALLARGRLDRLGGRRDSAEQRFREAIDRDPDLLEARCDLGLALLERGQAAEARDVLERAVARAPWRASARVALARARLALGDSEAAVRDLQAVISERPEEPGAFEEARRTLQSLRGR